MSERARRWVVRAIAVAIGMVAFAGWQQPWAQPMPFVPWLWTCLGGVLGLIVSEPIRRRMAGQAALDRAEEDDMTEEQFQRLRRIRIWIRCLVMIPALVFINIALAREIGLNSGMVFAMNGFVLIAALLLAEFLITLDPRQAICTRIIARRQRERFFGPKPGP